MLLIFFLFGFKMKLGFGWNWIWLDGVFFRFCFYDWEMCMLRYYICFGIFMFIDDFDCLKGWLCYLLDKWFFSG